MQVILITDWNKFIDLREEWNNLLSKSRANNIFLTWEWIWSWSNSGGKNREIYLITVMSDSKLVAVFPLYFCQYRLFGLVKLKALRFFCDSETGAEYPDLICDENHLKAADLIVEHLKTFRSRWNFIWIPNVSDRKSRKSLIEKCSEKGDFSSRKRIRDFSHITLPNNFDDYFNSFSSKHRTKFRKLEKQIKSLGEVRMEVLETNTDYQSILDRFFLLHGKSREMRNDPGVFVRKPNERLFYEFMVPLAIKNDWLRMFCLKVNGEIEAIQLGYIYGDVYYQLQEGFNTDMPPGIGNWLRLKSIQYLIENGTFVYDFLGEHTEHKKRWKAIKETGSDIIIFNSTLKSKLLHCFTVWPTGKYLKAD